MVVLRGQVFRAWPTAVSHGPLIPSVHTGGHRLRLPAGSVLSLQTWDYSMNHHGNGNCPPQSRRLRLLALVRRIHGVVTAGEAFLLISVVAIRLVALHSRLRFRTRLRALGALTTTQGEGPVGGALYVRDEFLRDFVGGAGAMLGRGRGGFGLATMWRARLAVRQRRRLIGRRVFPVAVRVGLLG